jgi:NAD(P)H-dependent FMN reductase
VLKEYDATMTSDLFKIDLESRHGTAPRRDLERGASSLRVLAVSGSLRARSINSALLRVAARVAPAGVEVEAVRGLGELPLFNPDLDERPPPQVLAFREAIARADALVIASPEYAHGVTGTIKNALDWLVSFEPFIDKRVAVVNAAARASIAHAALCEILKTMNAHLVPGATVTLPFLAPEERTEEGLLHSEPVVTLLQQVLTALRDAAPARVPSSHP